MRGQHLCRLTQNQGFVDARGQRTISRQVSGGELGLLLSIIFFAYLCGPEDSTYLERWTFAPVDQNHRLDASTALNHSVAHLRHLGTPGTLKCRI